MSERASASDAFVGRDRELAELGRALDDAAAGHGRLALIAGEAGIGKTRLADELAARAAAAGICVLWGRCWEGDGAPAFWPWVQVIRGALAALDAPIPALESGGAARLAQLAPELAERLGTTPAVSRGEDPDRARFRLFDVVASFLKDAAASRPLLVILDDLHCADPSPLLLLKFVSAELRRARIVVLGIYREIEARRTERMRVVIGDLVRDAREITLSGFDDGEVGRFIASAAETPPSDRLIRAVREATGGNPFFVSEVVRLLAARAGKTRWAESPPRSLPVPPSVRATIRRRLDLLPEGSRELLSVASFIGREFDLNILERASGVGGDAVLEHLGRAVADGFAQRIPNTIAAYRFSHDLIRETLYEDATPVERVRRHRRVGETIEELHRATLDAHVGELAHHFAEAAEGGDAEKALDYAMRAGEGAYRALAYEEAAEHIDRAKRIVELYGLRDDAFRFELLLALGEAHKRAGEIEAAKASFGSAAEMAEASGSARQLAQAAVGYPFAFGGLGRLPVPVDEILIGWLRRALAGIGCEDASLRAGLLSRLALELYWSSNESHALSEEAVRLARQSGRPRMIASVLVTRLFVLAVPGAREESLELADEVVKIGEDTGSKGLIVSGRFWRIATLFRFGDRPAIDAEIAAQARLAEELREPRFRWFAAVHLTARDLLSASPAEAERIGRRLMALAEAVQEPRADMLFTMEMLHPFRELGRLGELLEPCRVRAAESPSIAIHRAFLAWLHAELGHEIEARRELDTLAARDFTELRLDQSWLALVSLLAEVSDRLADGPRAQLLYDLLVPFAAQSALIGPGLAYIGSVAHYLGILARRLGRWQVAGEHFEAALEAEAKMAAPLFVARTQYETARLLLEQRVAGGRERAAELLAQVIATADRFGLSVLRQEAEALAEGGERMRLTDPAVPLEARPATGNVFRRDGDSWTIAFEGNVLRVRDMKGLHYIAHLLREPEREFHVADLILALHGESASRPVAGDAGEVRRASSDSERARLMVTQRIRGAIRKIAAARPPLGRHLEACIRTGSFCSYVPPAPVVWEL